MVIGGTDEGLNYKQVREGTCEREESEEGKGRRAKRRKEKERKENKEMVFRNEVTQYG